MMIVVGLLLGVVFRTDALDYHSIFYFWFRSYDGWSAYKCYNGDLHANDGSCYNCCQDIAWFVYFRCALAMRTIL
jgi:hypothetical protein